MTNETTAASKNILVFSMPEFDVLSACQEAVARQHELLPLLAATLRVPESEVFYAWAERNCEQHGDVQGTDWWYFFHGLECDLRNRVDGRILRIDFGPRGTVDTFTAWGVLQFITFSVAPWPDYSRLKEDIGANELVNGEFIGDRHKYDAIWDALCSRGMLERAAPDLLALQARYTSKTPEGFDLIRFPDDVPQRTLIDCSVAHRLRLSDSGKRALSQKLQDARMRSYVVNTQTSVLERERTPP
jgi:hypothetical protein